MKKPEELESFNVIADLLKCLIDFSENLTEPPYDSKIIPEKERKPEKHKFRIRTPEDRLNAIVTLLFPQPDTKKNPGNRSFYKHDAVLMRQLITEQKRENLGFNQLIDKYIPLAQGRSKKTDPESIRKRLEAVYYDVRKEKYFPSAVDLNNFDYGEDFSKDSSDKNIQDELSILSTWLDKYRPQLINFLKN